MNIKRTTTSPYHPQTNAQVEVCNKTVAQYLRTQVENITLDWELYMAPMAFAYNTSFHRTIKTTPFKLTFGHNARTINFQEERKHYGEDKGTELFQTMQTSHESFQIFKMRLGNPNKINLRRKNYFFFNNMLRRNDLAGHFILI